MIKQKTRKELVEQIINYIKLLGKKRERIGKTVGNLLVYYEIRLNGCEYAFMKNENTGLSKMEIDGFSRGLCITFPRLILRQHLGRLYQEWLRRHKLKEAAY